MAKKGQGAQTKTVSDPVLDFFIYFSFRINDFHNMSNKKLIIYINILFIIGKLIC